MDFIDSLKKFFIQNVLGITRFSWVDFTIQILNWDKDCTSEKAAEIEGLTDIKGYGNRIGAMVDWVSKEIFCTFEGPHDSYSVVPLTLEEVRHVEGLLLKVLEEKGYKAVISKEKLGSLGQK